MDVRRGVGDERSPEGPVGPVLSDWMREQTTEPERLQAAQGGAECPLCGQELVFGFSQIPGARAEFAAVGECARHGVVG